MTPMLGRIRQRHHSADVHRRFVNETIEGLQTLHRRIWEIEERLLEQQATNAELERRTARVELEASAARLGFQDLVKRYAAAKEPLDGDGEQQESAEMADLEAEQSPELLDGLMGDSRTPEACISASFRRPRGTNYSSHRVRFRPLAAW
jgi:hypothetical protein